MGHEGRASTQQHGDSQGFRTGLRRQLLALGRHLLPRLPLQKKKIVFCSFDGKGFGDNGKYIALEILRQKLDVDLVWLIHPHLMDKARFPSGVRPAPYWTLQGLYEMATAKVWLDNARKVFYPVKRKDQYYIQTWHGGLGMKRSEKEVIHALDPTYVQVAIQDSKMADLFISNSDYQTKKYRNAYWYDGEIMESGLPRNDIFFQDAAPYRRHVRAAYGIPADNPIVLYAPTFRAQHGLDVYNLDYDQVKNALAHRFGGEWTMMVRLHPNMSYLADQVEGQVVNATRYDDMMELLAACDVLITDYSSSAFDFALTRRPCFLYLPDVAAYQADRDLSFPLHVLPFPQGETGVALADAIRVFDQGAYVAALDGFYAAQGLKDDGHGSERVVERIRDIIGG